MSDASLHFSASSSIIACVLCSAINPVALTRIQYELQFVWALIENENQATGLDVLAMVTPSSKKLPRYEAARCILVVDSANGHQVLLDQLLEGLALHAARAVLDESDPGTIPAWKSAVAKAREGYRQQLETHLAGAATRPMPAKKKRKSQATTGVGRGNWYRGADHACLCRGTKRDQSPCRSMRVAGSEFCWQHRAGDEAGQSAGDDAPGSNGVR